jgi:hypothetical protein
MLVAAQQAPSKSENISNLMVIRESRKVPKRTDDKEQERKRTELGTQAVTPVPPRNDQSCMENTKAQPSVQICKSVLGF